MGELLFHLAKLNEKQHKYNEAANLYLQASKERKQVFLSHSPFTAEALIQAGVCYLKLDQLDLAKQYLNEALSESLLVHIRNSFNQSSTIYNRFLQLHLIKGDVVEAKKTMSLMMDAQNARKQTVKDKIKQKEMELDAIFSASSNNQEEILTTEDRFQNYDDFIFHITAEELEKNIRNFDEESQLILTYMSFAIAFLEGNAKKARDIILSAELSSRTNRKMRDTNSSMLIRLYLLFSKFQLQENEIEACEKRLEKIRRLLQLKTPIEALELNSKYYQVMGQLSTRKAKYEEARLFLSKAKDMSEILYGSSFHHRVGECLVDIAQLDLIQGNRASALKLAQRAKTIQQQKQISPDHPLSKRIEIIIKDCETAGGGGTGGPGAAAAAPTAAATESQAKSQMPADSATAPSANFEQQQQQQQQIISPHQAAKILIVSAAANQTQQQQQQRNSN